MKDFLFVTLLLAAGACTPTSTNNVPGEIGIDSLLSGQARLLAERKVGLTKTASVFANDSATSFIPSPTEWKEELMVFRVLGTLDQKLYRGTYHVEGPLDDPNSNLSIRRFTNQQSPLRSLQVYYQEDFSRIRKLSGIYEEANPLYKAHRELTMHFDEFQGKPALTSYAIEGFQKVAMRDTVKFAVAGIVNW